MTSSRADRAYDSFSDLLADNDAFSNLNTSLTESDTRAKIIDPMFKEVLGWNESEISREEAAADGYSDYVLGLDFNHLHVEAKRTLPKFEIQSTGKRRNLKLSGPHLLNNKTIKPSLIQTAKYSVDLGTEYAVLTNGTQYVVFQTYIRGKTWREGVAFVWHDLNDIRDHFAQFFGLLSADNVKSGSLYEAFSHLDGRPREHHLPSKSTHNPDREFIRNKFWTKISAVFGPLLSPETSDPTLQTEIVRKCYVSTPLADDANSEINELLRDSLPENLKDLDFQHLNPGSKIFDFAIENDVKRSRAATYVLTGGVGSGKTTFLQRFATVVQPHMIQRYCLWIHIDYLAFSKLPPDKLSTEFESLTYKRIREVLVERYSDEIPKTGDSIRKLFSEQLEATLLTKLHGVKEGSTEWTREINAVVSELYDSDIQFVSAVLSRLTYRYKRIVLVLDNSDQLGEAFQESVFLFAQRLSRELGAVAIVSLREEKFFAAYRRGVIDAFGDRRFHIGSPDLKTVIRRRLEYGIDKYLTAAARNGVPSYEQDDVVSLVRSMIESTTNRNANISRMLSCVSVGDMRLALSMFRAFVSSGNTNVDKILKIVKSTGRYTVPFHEFAKSAILGKRRYFKGDVSHVVNLFAVSSASRASHLTACRVLRRLTDASTSPSQYGRGFVDTSSLYREFRSVFGAADELVAQLEVLLRRGLLESEPPKQFDSRETSAIRISASGAYYWQFLVRSFAYLDLVYFDTPFNDKDLAHTLSSMSDVTGLSVRFERVMLFLEYLQREETEELSRITCAEGGYTSSVVVPIREQIRTEIEVIKSKTGAIELNE